MSRIGRKPIGLPEGVTVQERDGMVVVQGPKGILEFSLPPSIELLQQEEKIVIRIKRKTKKSPALWGLTRALIANAVEGVTQNFEKKLEIEGVGYRVAKEEDAIVLQLGFSHPVRVKPPRGVTLEIEKNTITVSGIDKQKVGQVAASIRALRKPEPYKGKGIRYAGETIRRKAGKKAGVIAK